MKLPVFVSKHQKALSLLSENKVDYPIIRNSTSELKAIKFKKSKLTQVNHRPHSQS